MSQKILILLTSFNKDEGGIQTVSSDIIDALTQNQNNHVWVCSLNDKYLPKQENNITLRCFCHKKISFVFHAFWLTFKVKPKIVILGHLNFLPIVPLLKRICKARCFCWLYGTEAWNRRAFWMGL